MSLRKILNRIHPMALTKWCKLSIDLRALLTWTFWNEQTKRTSENFSFRVKRNKLRELIWPIKLKPHAVKYQSPGFPWNAAHDVPRPWFFLTRRNGRIRSMALSDTSRSDLGHAKCRGISRPRKSHEITLFTQLIEIFAQCVKERTDTLWISLRNA